MGSIVPFVASAADLLSKVGTDDFKKLFKPSALVSAAVVLALHLLLVLPPLLRQEIPSNVAIGALDPLWITLAISLALPVLAYVLDSLQGFFIDFLTGWVWRDSAVIGTLMTTRQQRIFDSLANTVKTAADNTSVSTAASRLALEFPRDRNSVGPTQFGNVLRSTATYTLNQYGMHLGTIWPLVELKLQKTDQELWNRIRGGEDSVGFLAGLTFLLMMIGVEIAVVWALLGQPIGAFWSLPVFASAIPVYKASIQRARALGREMRLAFDLYHELAAEQLQLVPLEAFEERKTRWKKISDWLLYGGLNFTDLNHPAPIRSPEWFAKEAAPEKKQFELTYPPNITVKDSATTHYYIAKENSKKWNIGFKQSFFFNITNANITDNVAYISDTFLMVTHLDRVILPIKEVSGLLYSAQSGIVSTIAPIVYGDKGFVWMLGRLSAGVSRTLTYDFESDTTGFVMLSGDRKDDIDITKVSVDQANKQIIVDAINLSKDPVRPEFTVLLPANFEITKRVYFRQGGKTSNDNIEPILDNANLAYRIPIDIDREAVFQLIVVFNSIEG